MPTPLISAVITTWNRAHMVPRAIRSVQDQTCDSIEIIVVDDASEDDTVNVVSRLDDPRVRLIVNETNRGPGGAKNAGVNAARGEYIAFLDSDDEWLPQKLERQLRAMSAADASPMSVTSCWIEPGNGSRFVRRYITHRDSLTAIASGEMYNFGSTSMIRRSCFSEVGAIREDLTRFEDVEWMLRYSLRNEFLVLEEPLSVIASSGSPSRSTVAESTRIFAEATDSYLRTQLPEIHSLVRGSLLYENALAAWRDGSRARAVWVLCEMLRSSPAHIPLFVRRVMRKLGELRTHSIQA
ncbi:MAG TPA: glycosyltransferase family 2 protein [Thermoanaerobaculia bacterium]